jgi:hypothetical protein
MVAKSARNGNPTQIRDREMERSWRCELCFDRQAARL